MMLSKYKLGPKEEDQSEFRKRVFPKIDNLKGEDLLKLLKEDVKFNKLDDEDVVQVCHEVHVHTEVLRFVDKEEVRTQAVDQEDLLKRAVLAQTVKEQQQMIVDCNVVYFQLSKLPKNYALNDNQYDNVPVGGLDHRSMDGVSQCMNVDRLDKSNDVLDNFPIDGLDNQSVEGVSHFMSVDHISQRLNEADESVSIDGLIRLRSQDVDHTSKMQFMDDNEVKVKENEELMKEASFISTQHVTELINKVFDTPSGPNSIQDVGGFESMYVDQPMIKNVKDVGESDIKTVLFPF
nr:hypothetical protein [Tanacetum cinerariifolium]